jgi:phosphoglucosamine mutase
MARKYFGTDGVRGRANSGAMTADMVLKIGMAAGNLYRRGNHRHRVVIGKDTRLSGYMIENALTCGPSCRRHGRVPVRPGAHPGGRC